MYCPRGFKKKYCFRGGIFNGYNFPGRNEGKTILTEGGYAQLGRSLSLREDVNSQFL